LPFSFRLALQHAHNRATAVKVVPTGNHAGSPAKTQAKLIALQFPWANSQSFSAAPAGCCEFSYLPVHDMHHISKKPSKDQQQQQQQQQKQRLLKGISNSPP